MLKANSLLYAVYICLLVAILCGALLYYATLFDRLNSFYSENRMLYTQNESAVIYALGSDALEGTTSNSDSLSVQSNYSFKSFGLLKLLSVTTYNSTDTLTSVHLVGTTNKTKTALWVSSLSKPLSYSGNVTIIGNKIIPTAHLEEKFTTGVKNELHLSGLSEDSPEQLPNISNRIKEIVNKTETPIAFLRDLTPIKNQEYYNSFEKQTQVLQWNNSLIDHIVLKGNFILIHKDSLVVDASAQLEDVILKSPKVTFRKGFQGVVQAYATNQLVVEPQCKLRYPSVIGVYNGNSTSSKITIGEAATIEGSIVLCGNSLKAIDDNSIIMEPHSKLMGDLYCSGKTMLKGSVFGTVYTHRFFHQTLSSMYENCLINTTIDLSKLPAYWVSIPILDSKNNTYGLCKKVF